MNSSTEHEFDEQLDRLLAETVRPGTEPVNLPAISLPERPRLNWVRILLGLTVLIPPGALFIVWVSRQSLNALAARTMPVSNVGMQLTDSILAATERLMSADVLMFAAVLTGAVYLFCANRLVHLFRLC